VLGGLMKLWALNLVAMNLADAILTLMLVGKRHQELNPIWVAAMAQGDWSFIALKVLAGMLVAGVLMHLKREALLEWSTIGMMLVVLWNGVLVLAS
jgi:hypothetical protein